MTPEIVTTMEAKFTARLVLFLIKSWPAYRRYMAAYREVARREYLQEMTASLQAIEHAGFIRGVAATKRALLPEQETPDA